MDNRYEEWIPSGYVREFYKENGITFTDYEWACIFWNQQYYASREEMLAVFERIGRETADEELKRIAADRLTYEAECERFLADNGQGKYVYLIRFENDDWQSGIFTDLGTAVKAGRLDKEKRDFTVEKQLIVGEVPKMVYNSWEVNPHLFPEGKEAVCTEYSGDPVAGADYGPDGVQMRIWVNDRYLPEEIAGLVDIWGERGFNKAIYFECPFERGDVVRVTGSGELGVVETSEEERMKMWERYEQGQYYDYLDCSTITVQILGEDGRFSHEHLCILELEKLTDEGTEEDKEKMVRLAAKFLKGGAALDYFLMEYDAYRETGHMAGLWTGDRRGPFHGTRHISHGPGLRKE